MKKELLCQVRKSIGDGYLPQDWHEHRRDVVQTETGYLALSDDCVRIGSNYYHRDWDSDYYEFDERDECYILSADSIKVHDGLEKSFYTHLNNRHAYFLHRCGYYTLEGLEACDLVLAVDGVVARREDVWYWESDGQYHWEEDDDENDSDSEIWGYHAGPCPPDYREDKGSPGIGFEIEKGDEPEFCGCYGKEELYDQTGCVMEEDGSVDWELKTPIYPLFSERIETEWLPEIELAINADNHDNAGGHIHLSLPPKPGWQVFDYCRPYLPLLMAMYPKRLEKDYCKGKPEHQLKQDNEKHQAIKIWDDRIELRFPAKVYNMKALVFRLNFCRLMIKKDYKNILSATLAAFDNETKLSGLIMSMYQGKELLLLTRIMSVAKAYFNTDLSKEKSIENLINHLKNKKPCVLPS